MSRGMWVLVAALSAAALGPVAALAQEAARVEGVRLPAGYYERVGQRPDIFQLNAGWIARAGRAREAAVALADTLRSAVVLALFSDSPEPHVTHEDVQRALFDGPSAYGTVTAFYEEASGGRFSLVGQTFPWVRTSLTMAEVVGDNYGLGDDAEMGAYLSEALQAADTLVDFGLFDNDGPDGVPNSGDDDGAVDAVAFEFLEIAASCGGPAIWPHRSRISGWLDDPYVTDDPRTGGGAIVVNDYIVQSVVDCGGVETQKATTIAHEMGHVLGLPDLYDRSQGLLPEERRWVVGCWSLMAAGAWGCGVDNREGWFRPTHMGAWERSRLGWITEITDVTDVIEQEFTLSPILTSERILRIPLESGADPEAGEYLLVEYRSQEGFDLDLPAAGVLVYHIDPRIRGNQPCDSCPQLYRVAVLEADGNNTLQRNFLQGGNRGEPTDAWAVAGPGTLGNSTNPSTRLNSGAASPVTIHEISVANGVAHLTITSVTLEAWRLVQRFLGSAGEQLTAEELSYLDRIGNENGQYDVGDLRAYLKR